MPAKTLILLFTAFGSLAQAAETRRVYRTIAPMSSDATQADILTQIDVGVRDFDPSLSAPNWVIYPEDYPKIGVAASDRQTTLELKTLEEIDESFGMDPDLDEILVQ